MSYQPTQADIAWLQRLVTEARDGDLWTDPLGSRYRFDVTNKTLVLIGAYRADEFDRTSAVARAIGWQTKRT